MNQESILQTIKQEDQLREEILKQREITKLIKQEH
jgi:hypothetical protein